MRLLVSLEPRLDLERYAFESAGEPEIGSAFALIREEEGLTVIRSREDGEWARITLQVHSSLSAVGLTATLSTALAKANISANIVAGLRHDHLFVPWEKRDEALRILQALASA